MELFESCFRIQREASATAGHHIPMVVENVRGAQKYVGRAAWHYGSYYLWGDVPALMPITHRAQKVSGGWFTRAGEGSPHCPARATNATMGIARSTKNTGGSWFNVGSPGQKVVANNARDALVGPRGGKIRHDPRYPHLDPNHPDYYQFEGVKHSAPGPRENGKGPASSGSKSPARKAASALIARIPQPLSQHIADVYWPLREGPA